MLVLSFFTLSFLTTNTVEAISYTNETECPTSPYNEFEESHQSCRAEAFCPTGKPFTSDNRCWVTAECPEGYKLKGEDILAYNDQRGSDHQGFHFHKDLWCEPVKSCNDGDLNIFGNCQMKPLCPGEMKLDVFGKCQVISKIDSCPEDTKRNVFGNCQAKPTCSQGTLNVFGDCQTKPSCPSGSVAVLGKCEKIADCVKRGSLTGICTKYSCDSGWKRTVAICSKDPSCESGMSMKGTVCVKSPDCPTGTSLNDIGVCIGKQERSCPLGLTPTGLGYCITEPTCWLYWTYNEITNRCEKAPDSPGDGLLDPCPYYYNDGEKTWNDNSDSWKSNTWNEYRGSCQYAVPTCMKHNEISGQDYWEPITEGYETRIDSVECIFHLCKNSDEHPVWIESTRCDVQGTSSSPDNLEKLPVEPEGSPEKNNPDENIILEGYSLSRYVFENPDKITSEEIIEIYQNDEQFRDWISENSPGTSIETVIEQLNESYEKLADSASEPDNDRLPITKLDKKVPEWIKDQSKWWISGAISDREFIQLFEYLIENKIINVPNLPEPKQVDKAPIPSWFKNNVKWWINGQITDFDFAKGLEHLIKVGVVVIQKN